MLVCAPQLLRMHCSNKFSVLGHLQVNIQAAYGQCHVRRRSSCMRYNKQLAMHSAALLAALLTDAPQQRPLSLAPAGLLCHMPHPQLRRICCSSHRCSSAASSLTRSSKSSPIAVMSWRTRSRKSGLPVTSGSRTPEGALHGRGRGSCGTDLQAPAVNNLQATHSAGSRLCNATLMHQGNGAALDCQNATPARPPEADTAAAPP